MGELTTDKRTDWQAPEFGRPAQMVMLTDDDGRVICTTSIPVCPSCFGLVSLHDLTKEESAELDATGTFPRLQEALERAAASYYRQIEAIEENRAHPGPAVRRALEGVDGYEPIRHLPRQDKNPR